MNYQANEDTVVEGKDFFFIHDLEDITPKFTVIMS